MATRSFAATLARAAGVTGPRRVAPVPRRTALLRFPSAPLLPALAGRRSMVAKASMVREGGWRRGGEGVSRCAKEGSNDAPTRFPPSQPFPPLSPSTLPHPQEDLIREKNAHNPVVVYSRPHCPYCADVKALFASLGVTTKVIELDTLPDVAAALASVTGSTSVPQVFVGGVHVGGCDDTVAANASGELAKLLDAAGVGAKA